MATRRAPAGYKPDLPPGCTQRFYREGNEHGILELLKEAFEGSWPRRVISVPAIEHLRWKLHSDPLAACLHLVAELDGRIIGARPMWVDRVKVGNRVLLTRLAIDRAIAPEFQRMRVMTAMEARTPDEWFSLFDVLVGVVNDWQSISFVPGTAYRRKLDVVGRKLGGNLPDTMADGWSVRRVDLFDERIDDLWNEASPSLQLAMLRTKERLNYRYADPRAGDYRIVTAEQGERVLGYIVYTSRRGTGQIADMLVRPDRLDVLESLLGNALCDLQTTGATSAECWRDLHHPYGRVLERLGFGELRRRQRMSLHALRGGDAAASFFADPKSAVHITAGDTDLV